MSVMSFFRRFMRRQDGAAAAEVALLFPLITWPFFLCMEAGFMQMRRVMMERAIDVVARDIRLGKPGLDTADRIKAAVCDQALVLPTCMSDLMLEMTPVQVENFQPPSESATCVDRSKDAQPKTTFKPGTINEMMMMRFCILYDPILPGAGIGARMEQVNGGGVAIIASTFFVNEP